MPHQSVRDIFCDQDGVLWLATNYELTRFDGSNIKVYDRQLLDSVVVGIHQITQDQHSRLWLWGKSGCNLFDPYKEESERDIVCAGEAPLFPGFNSEGALQFNLGNDNTICTVLANGSLDCKVLPFEEPFNLLPSASKESYWARSGNTLLLLDHEWSVKQKNTIDDLGMINHATVTNDGDLLLFYESIIPRGETELVLLTKSGVLLDCKEAWGLDTLKNVYFESGNQHIWLEYADCWEIRSIKGDQLVKIDKETDRAKGFSQNVSDPWGQVNDQEGALWLCTNYGFVKLSSRRKLFASLLDQGSVSNGDNIAIRGLWSNGDEIMIAAERHGVFFKKKGEPIVHVEQIQEYDKSLIAKSLKERKNGGVQSDCRGLHRIRSGDFLIGSEVAVLRYNLDEESVMHYPPAFEYDIDYGINPWCFQEMDDGRILVGAHPGLKYISTADDSLRIVETSISYDAIRDAAIYRIIRDETSDSEGYWLATSLGLFYLNSELEISKHFHSEGLGVSMLLFDDLYSVTSAQDGKLWLATNGSGLLLLDTQTGLERQWTVRDGLPSNVIYTVEEDDYGYVWLASKNGLIRLDTSENIIQVFFEDAGLPHREFNRIANFKTAEGTLLFGTVNGLTIVEPSRVLDSEKGEAPAVRIANYHKRSKGDKQASNLIHWLRKDSLITIAPRDELVQLTVNMPVYERDVPVYFYRIDEGDWMPMRGNVLQLGNYDYGEHTLEVSAKLKGRRFKVEPLKLRVFVETPYFPKTYFFILIAMAATGIGYLLMRYQVDRLLRQRQKLEEKVKAATAQLEKDRDLIREQADKLEKADKLKTRFFANVSHELRTPLTLIIAPLEKLSEGDHLSKEDSKAIELARSSSEDLLRNVNAILDLAKVDATVINVDKSATNIVEACNAILKRFENKAKQEEVNLRFKLPVAQLGVYELDFYKVDTIISNLLVNALRFTPSGGQVTLELLIPKENQLAFIIEDTGVGIPEEDLPHLFDRFYQSTHASRKGGGTGIGLALCAEFAALLKGSLTVESQLGEGSKFQLTIPAELIEYAAVKDEPFVFSASGTSMIPEAQDGKEYVLIVEDHTGMRNFLYDTLKETYNVVVANNGKHALDLLAQRLMPPVLILTDIMMPVMDGVGLISELKKSQKLSSVPIIVLSSKSNVHDRIKVLHYGIDDYMGKPFYPNELLVRAEQLIQKYRERMNAKVAIPTDAEEAVFADTPNDPEWLGELESLVVQHLNDRRLSASYLAELSFISTRQLQRRLKQATGYSTLNYIKEVRLNEAMRLLESGRVDSVKVVASKTGFKNADYFSKLFKMRFGRLPSSYL